MKPADAAAWFKAHGFEPIGVNRFQASDSAAVRAVVSASFVSVYAVGHGDRGPRVSLHTGRATAVGLGEAVASIRAAANGVRAVV